MKKRQDEIDFAGFHVEDYTETPLGLRRKGATHSQAISNGGHGPPYRRIPRFAGTCFTSGANEDLRLTAGAIKNP
ncbi:MAG: hypothetical protein KAT56_06260 [Sedimentisphaerales bacterium]|nr:hypothetical protein [Sedimentisphaerales bacterium]